MEQVFTTPKTLLQHNDGIKPGRIENILHAWEEKNNHCRMGLGDGPAPAPATTSSDSSDLLLMDMARSLDWGDGDHVKHSPKKVREICQTASGGGGTSSGGDLRATQEQDGECLRAARELCWG